MVFFKYLNMPLFTRNAQVLFGKTESQLIVVIDILG